MKAPDHIAAVVALRQLSGREMPLHKRIGETCAAVDCLATATRSWPAFSPRLPALDAAVTQADAIARSLRELRAALHSEGGPPNAA